MEVAVGAGPGAAPSGETRANTNAMGGGGKYLPILVYCSAVQERQAAFLHALGMVTYNSYSFGGETKQAERETKSLVDEWNNKEKAPVNDMVPPFYRADTGTPHMDARRYVMVTQNRSDLSHVHQDPDSVR